MSCFAPILSLLLRDCTGLPGAAYAQILLQCRLLRTYALAGGEENGISANVFAPLLVSKHPSLEDLDMWGCPAIADRTLECIQFGLKGTLKDLNLRGNPLVTEDGILTLCSELPQLTQLCLDEDNLLSEGCLDKLTEYFQMPESPSFTYIGETDFIFKRGVQRGWARSLTGWLTAGEKPVYPTWCYLHEQCR